MGTTLRILAPYENDLHEAASRKTGLRDFGDPSYRRGLRVLLESFDTELQLSEGGWRVACSIIIRNLIARLHTQKGWGEYPQALATPIKRPLVILGLPRSGTTALHRLLSEDTQFQGLQTWLSQTPMIRPPRETWERHPAYLSSVANLEALDARAPDLRKLRYFSTAGVEECSGVLMQSFMNSAWSVAYSLRTYDRWFLSQSSRDSYYRYVDVLRLIGAREPHKRWLLKSPHHMFEIDALLAVFPDACIIQTHRDPLKAVPSVCSLVHKFRRDLEGDSARRDDIGVWQCSHWRRALDHMRTAREVTPAQFVDVDHRRFLDDPMGTVHAIYEYFELALSQEAEQRMEAWIAACPTSKHGPHDYSIECWGITSDYISETFANYRAQYGFR